MVESNWPASSIIATRLKSRARSIRALAPTAMVWKMTDISSTASKGGSPGMGIHLAMRPRLASRIAISVMPVINSNVVATSKVRLVTSPGARTDADADAGLAKALRTGRCRAPLRGHIPPPIVAVIKSKPIG